MIFLSTAILSIILTIVVGVWWLRNGKYGGKYIIRAVIVGAILIPIVGGAQGSFYSHGFDIPWWFFGIANLLVIFAAAILTVTVYKLLAVNKFR